MAEPCDVCSGACAVERVHFFPRQLLAAHDLTSEQDYVRQKLRRHNRLLHGWGVVCGTDVRPNPDKQHPWRVRVCPGYVLTPQGDEVVLCDGIDFDLAGDRGRAEDPCAGAWPCPPVGAMPHPGQREPVYLAVRYTECRTRPVRVAPVGCGCEDSGCDYSRIRESFELKLLWQLPESHVKATAADQKWTETVQAWQKAQRPGDPAPPCDPCTAEPWVVLATIRLPDAAAKEVATANITYADRRVVPTTVRHT